MRPTQASRPRQAEALTITTPLRGWRVLLRVRGQYKSPYRDTVWEPGVWQRLPSVASPEEWHTLQHHRRRLVQDLQETHTPEVWSAVLTSVPWCSTRDTACSRFAPLYRDINSKIYSAYDPATQRLTGQVHLGFFAFARKIDLMECVQNMTPPLAYFAPQAVWLAEVEMCGTVHEYTRGYRAQAMRVTHLEFP